MCGRGWVCVGVRLHLLHYICYITCAYIDDKLVVHVLISNYFQNIPDAVDTIRVHEQCGILTATHL